MWSPDSVSSVRYPTGVSDKDFRGQLKTRHNIHIAGGQGTMEGQIFRVNHMGYILLAAGAAGVLAHGDAQARALAVTGGVTQMVSHGLLTGALFLLSGVLYNRGGSYDMDAYSGLAAPAAGRQPPADGTVEGDRLQRDVALVVVHRDHQVIGAPHRLQENRVRSVRPAAENALGARGFDGR